MLGAAIIVGGMVIVKVATRVLFKRVAPAFLEEDQKGVLEALEGVVRYFLYVLVILVGLASMGIDVWPIIASLGVGSLAISLAMKDILTDYIAGFILILGRNIRKGQRIIVKDKGVEGIVEEVTWRYTLLRTEKGEMITIPNRVMNSSVIIVLQ